MEASQDGSSQGIGIDMERAISDVEQKPGSRMCGLDWLMVKACGEDQGFKLRRQTAKEP